MLLNEVLLEADRSDYLIKSFQILTGGGNQGKFKSEKQAKFLLSKCEQRSDGKYYFELRDRLRFGEFGGASAIVNWVIICDDQGVEEILKSTGAKPTPITTFKRGSKESLEKDATKKRQREEGIQERIADLRAELQTKQHEIDEANNYYKDFNEKLKIAISKGMDRELFDSVAKDQLEKRDKAIKLANYSIDIIKQELAKFGVTE